MKGATVSADVRIPYVPYGPYRPGHHVMYFTRGYLV